MPRSAKPTAGPAFCAKPWRRVMRRAARVAMEIEPEMLASIADYQLRSGAHAAAVDKAREAIAVAQERHARLPECRATIALAAALAASNNPDHLGEVALLVDRAEAL